MDLKEQVRAYELEAELTRRFEAATSPAMTHSQYLRALASNTIRFTAEKIAAIEAAQTGKEST